MTHYDVLGVAATASTAEIRRAYHDKARQLHPDVVAGLPVGQAERARRAMQDVNEAWRILGDDQRRSAYDRTLLAAATPSTATDWLDEPIHHPPAERGDLTVAIVRAVPWVAVLVVLGVIVVFTAFAKHTTSYDELVDSCIVTHDGVPEAVPCDEPNDGVVVSVTDDPATCGDRAEARLLANGHYFCLQQ